MVSNCNINTFSNLTSIIYFYNENMNLEMTIKKLGSAYKFRVGRATGNEHIFSLALNRTATLLYSSSRRSRPHIFGDNKPVERALKNFKLYSHSQKCDPTRRKSCRTHSFVSKKH